MLKSRLCTQEQFDGPLYSEWCARIKETRRLHRKQWEFYFVAQALYERGMLAPGKVGLGFGVGREPLAALFASYGCSIVATDQGLDAAQAGKWVETGQYAGELEQLNERGICDAAEFRRLVSYRTVNMNAIPADLAGFDFVWSACSLDHLGTIERGQWFIHRAMDCLAPGGVAVHTTEFNVSSNVDTLDKGAVVLFRKKDIEEVATRLGQRGCAIDLDWEIGTGSADRYVDVHPYLHIPHLKVALGGYVSTSIGLIIEGDREIGRIVTDSGFCQ